MKRLYDANGRFVEWVQAKDLPKFPTDEEEKAIQELHEATLTPIEEIYASLGLTPRFVRALNSTGTVKMLSRLNIGDDLAEMYGMPPSPEPMESETVFK